MLTVSVHSINKDEGSSPGCYTTYQTYECAQYERDYQVDNERGVVGYSHAEYQVRHADNKSTESGTCS